MYDTLNIIYKIQLALLYFLWIWSNLQKYLMKLIINVKKQTIYICILGYALLYNITRYTAEMLFHISTGDEWYIIFVAGAHL